MPRNFQGGRNQNRRTERFIEESIGTDDRNYYRHDTRVQRGGSRQSQNQNHRGGNVKGGRIERQRTRGGFDSRRIATILEEDVDMAGSSGQNEAHQRYAPYRTGGVGGGGRRTQDRIRPNSNVRSPKSNALWSKVVIPHGKKYEKDMLLKTLLNASTIPFIPIYYHTENNNAIFFVEDCLAADALRLLHGHITLHDGFKLNVLVKASPAPNLPINEELKTKIKQVMSRRYDAGTKILNLSQFHLDEELCTEYYTPLSRENIMQTVVKIINEHIPDVQAIDASNNKLYSVEQMRSLVTKATSLKSLNLGNNKLAKINTLDRLQGLPLEELILHQNPLCDQFNDRSTYISAVRKRFPKIIKLDGIDLPPVISFDVGAEDVTMPVSKGSWFVSDQAKQISLLFLEQYIAIYDSDDRQPLLNAYHDSACLSMTISFPPGQSSTGSGRFDAYLKDSRNLKRVDDPQRRIRMLHQGKADVVAFLTKLPKSTHDPASLVVDVPVASAHLMSATVTGIFRERAERGSPLRWFQRVFIIVPQPNGAFCIVNEQLHISCATTEQVKAAFKGPEIAPPVAVPVPAVAPAVASVPISGQPIVDPVLRQQMVLSFAQQSGMNAEWSLKCLEDNGWDFDHAATVFMKLKEDNMIPPEAFI